MIVIVIVIVLYTRTSQRETASTSRRVRESSELLIPEKTEESHGRTHAGARRRRLARRPVHLSHNARVDTQSSSAQLRSLLFLPLRLFPR